MADVLISESGSAQFPMVKHAVEVGWTSVTPDDAKSRRGGIGGMLLRDALSAALTRFNTWLAPAAVNSIIETIDALPASVDGNREILHWLRGERRTGPRCRGRGR